MGNMIILCTILPVAANSLQSCLTLCDPIDGSPQGSPVPGILQARTLEWVAISFSNAWEWKVKVKSLSCVWLLATPWTAAHQAPLSMGFSRQEYWSGVSLPSPFAYYRELLFVVWVFVLFLGAFYFFHNKKLSISVYTHTHIHTYFNLYVYFCKLPWYNKKISNCQGNDWLYLDCCNLYKINSPGRN